MQVPLPGGGEKRIGVTRAHLEEDAGKAMYSGGSGGGSDGGGGDGSGSSGRLANSQFGLVDYNRAGARTAFFYLQQLVWVQCGFNFIWGSQSMKRV